MSVVILTTPPTGATLTSLATVKTEILVSGATHDAYLTALIAEATETIHHWAGRPLYRAKWTETTRGNQLSTMAMTRYPIASVDAVTFNGSTVTTEIDVQSAGGGLLERTSSTYSTLGYPDEWSFTYTAGWFCSGDDYSGTVSVDATDDSFNSAASDFHGLLRTGDVIYAAGFSNAANNGYHRIVTATTSKLVTASTLTTESAASRTLSLRNLPGWIERACLDLVRMAWFARDRDPALRQIGISGSISAAFDSQEATAIFRRVASLNVAA